MTLKERLSASVEADLLIAARESVAAGRADSLSAWVNDALRLKADHERRLAALDEFLADYENAHGPITDLDINDAVHRARGRAVVVRGGGGPAGRPTGGRPGAA